MKRILHAIALLTLVSGSQLASQAQTIFHDTFASGSTLNSQTPVDPTATSTSYELMSSKTWSPTPTINPGSLRFGIAATTAGHIELQALFTNSAIAIATNGDYIELQVTFVAATNILNQGQAWAFGLYNSGFPQSLPLAGGLNGVAVNTTTTNFLGGAQNWQGYWAQLFQTNAGSSVLRTRPVQTSPAGANDQDLVTTGSGSQSYVGGGQIGTNAIPSTNALIQGQTYTESLVISYVTNQVLAITNNMYNGVGTGGTLVPSFTVGSIATNTTFLTAGFDSFCIGWRATGSLPTLMDISSITINSQNSAPTPPVITSEPVSASAPVGGSVPFTVGANGINLTYQWMRNGTNIPTTNSPNLSVSSGAVSSTLVVSPISSADYSTYSCLVRGAGNLTTNTFTVSLSSRGAANLVWNGNLAAWDLTNSQSFNNGASASVWNYGDNVTFDDSASTFTTVNLSNFLSAGTVRVTGTANNYVFQNTASFGAIAGTAKFIYDSPVQVNMMNANTYTGGTLISNANALVFMANASAFGTGPVTNAVAGATINFFASGSATSGIGDLVLNDDLTVMITNNGFAGIILGDLRGVPGKTLTVNAANPTTTNSARLRVYGTNTTFGGNIVLNGNDPGTASALYGGTILAPYLPNGTQVYNGVISGVGGLFSGGDGTAIFNNQNTYSGGTIMRFGNFGVGVDSTPTSGTVTSGPLGVGYIFPAPDQAGGISTATIFSSGGAHTLANTIQWPSFTNNQVLQIGGTNAITFNGPVNLQPGGEVTNGPINRTFSVTNTALTTLNGVINDGGFGNGIIKQGSGILALTATENYIGPTLVSNGTLRVTGSLKAGSSVAVGTNATLGGTGTINGNVTIAQGGRLSPGASIGTLTVGGNLTNTGNLLIEVDRNGSPTSDETVVNGANLINNGTGTVTVTNLGAALQPNDSFTLFNKAMTGGNTLVINGAGVVWSNRLNLDGTIKVITLVSTQSTNITFSVSGGNTLNMSWPLDHQTWVLLSNSTGLGAVSNWFPVPNSSNVTSVSIPVAPNRANVFYRLVAP